jgi:hypothetical protein
VNAVNSFTECNTRTTHVDAAYFFVDYKEPAIFIRGSIQFWTINATINSAQIRESFSRREYAARG